MRPSWTTVGVRVLWWQSVGNQIFISKGTTTDGTAPRSRTRRFAFSARRTAQFVKHCGGHPRDGVRQQDARRRFQTARNRHGDGCAAASSPIASCGRWPTPSRAHCTRRSSSSSSSTRRSGSRCPRTTGPSSWKPPASEEQQSRQNVDGDRGRALHDVSREGHDRARPHARPGGRLARLQRHASSKTTSQNNAELARQLMAAYGKLRTDPCCTEGPSTAGSFSRR